MQENFQMVMSLQEQLVKMQSVSIQASQDLAANNIKQNEAENKPPATSKSSICLIQ